MRVWIYGRLSNDDDIQMDSLENQMEIGRCYADSHGYTIVGESFDDNVSGMRFDREGLNQVTQAVDAGKIDAVIVKDLSRLGRHQIQTALFIDYLRQRDIAVLSVTEGLNTLVDEDELMVGIRGADERLLCQGHRQQDPSRLSGEAKDRDRSHSALWLLERS